MRAHLFGRRVARAAAGACTLLLTAGAIAACGGSGKSAASTTSQSTSAATTQSSASSTTTASTSAATSASSSAALEARYKALEAAMAAYAGCMSRHGVPIAPPHRNSSGAPTLGAPRSTSTTSPRFDSALSDCRQQTVRLLALDKG